MPDNGNHQKPIQQTHELLLDRCLLIACGLCLTLMMALLLIFKPDPIHQAELRIYDLMLKSRQLPAQSTVPVLVGIDDESLTDFGQWPWPRYRLAMLIDRLKQMGADVISLDILMPEPDRSSPEVIQFERKRDRMKTPASNANHIGDSNSQRLATALSRSKTVLGYQLMFTDGHAAAQNKPYPATPDGLVISITGNSPDRWPQPTGSIRSLPQLTTAATNEGFTNTIKDIDGVLRRTPLLLRANGQQLTSLAMTATLLTTAERSIKLSDHADETYLDWNSRHIPLDPAGNMLLDFRDEQSFSYYSARDILKGNVHASLKGKIILIGSWATGLGDMHLVPSGRWMRGLEVHATIIDNIQTGKFIAQPGWTKGAELLSIMLLGILSTLLLSRSGFKLTLVLVITASAGCYIGCRQLLMTHGLYLSPLLTMLTPVIITMFLSLLKYGIEARKARKNMQSLIQAQDEIIISLSVLSETRDRETGRHILRTRRYVEILARQLATTKKYKHLDESNISLLAKSAPLHDIGKIGIPDAILHKPGKLDSDEYAIMKTHPLVGADALSKIVDISGHPENNQFLNYAREMTSSHHEKWDGSGYPYGLMGEDIPLAGRLMALADVFDALYSRRVYKKAYSFEETKQHILQLSGTHFDPDVVAAFMARSKDFLQVATELAEEPTADVP